ncbi:MAG: hypothetical protein IJZ57_10830 [Clostridia bacterium]|nr:hypothetical protein [Clostridia bacterium]
MTFDFSGFNLTFDSEIAQKAAELFKEEIILRIPDFDFNESFSFSFKTLCANESEDFQIEISDNAITISAHRLRGFIYGYSLFLRKSEIKNNCFVLLQNISGTYSPSKKIRGHQLGYRDTNNTCDAWSVGQYRRYLLDLMMFGLNTFEGICDNEKQNSLMKLSARDMLIAVAEVCGELDIDVSVWHPTYSKESDEEVKAKIFDYYGETKRLDALFIPGGDPGDMMPADFFKRCELIKSTLNEIHPETKLWISAQAPHEYADWGEKFIEEISKEPDFIEGIIYGPNHAMPLEDLRKAVPQKYPLRFYPDITHCVRCEYPVHFDKDDWHYAFASAFSRESVNPRPTEYRHIYRQTQNFVEGSVTYSDGIHDDLNKVMWSALDFDANCNIYEIAKDYARAYIPQVNADEFADCIFMLEKCWDSAPDESPAIDAVYKKLTTLATAENEKNYRFLMHLFAAECDMLIKSRFVFENELIRKAKAEILAGNIQKAEEILSTPYSEEYLNLREKINLHGKALFELIGMQLDVENYHGKDWDRGCTLETIDRPVTDRLYLLNKIKENPDKEFLLKIIDPHKGENYFSFAFHGFEAIGKQEGEFYMDFQGDRPVNDGTLPMRLTKVYDHYNIRFSFALKGNDGCKMRITYKNRSFDDSINQFKIKINGKEFYCGKPYDGEVDEEYSRLHLTDNYTAISYTVPKEFFKNGYAEVIITEPVAGFMISEISIKE